MVVTWWIVDFMCSVKMNQEKNNIRTEITMKLFLHVADVDCGRAD